MTHYGTVRALVLAAMLPLCASASRAQDATADQAKQQEEKAKLETKAIGLLEQVLSESQGLKLPENRIRVQIVAGDLLWDRSPARARSLFADAGAMLSQNIVDGDSDREDRQIVNGLRRELVLSAARHDAELGYQLLRQTQPPATTNADNNRRRVGFPEGDNLEQALLAVIAATDPKVAYQKASESLDKGEYPPSLTRVLSQLKAKDEDAFKKLSEKTLNRLSSENLLTSTQAANLATSLLRPGPQTASTATNANATATTTANGSRLVATPILTESAYHDLLDRAVTAALTATPRGNNSGGPNSRRARGGGVVFGGSPDVGTWVVDDSEQSQTDPAQAQQNNARMLLRNLQGMLSQIDQYLPERGQAVRQKLSELGMGNNTLTDFASQMRNVMQQGDSESLAAAASNAPGPLQSSLYRQAAERALDEGNLDRAQQIANDHLDENGRNAIAQAIDFKKMTTTVTAEKLGEIRQKLAALPSDSDRVKYLADLVVATQKDNPKLALKFAEDARAIVSKRATDYRDLDSQIRVAELFATLDPKRSFEVLEPGIAQLNELLAAAQVLNGFEVDVFREGEMPLQGGSQLGRVIGRFGQQLAALAKIDFERAQLTADRFQFSEPRLLVKLSIVQGAFGVRPTLDNDRRFNFRFASRE